MYRHSWLPLLFSLIPLWSGGAEASLFCSDVFQLESKLSVVQVAHGEWVLTPKELGLSSSAQVYKLGSGLQGGTVYRVFQEGFPTRVLKRFYFAEEDSYDLARMERIQSALAKIPPSLPAFKLPKVRRLGSQLIEIENLEGETLASVLSSPNVSLRLKAALRSRYQQAFENLVTAFREEYPQLYQNSEGYIQLGKAFDEEKKFFLKQDNILVTPGLELYVIDPY